MTIGARLRALSLAGGALLPFLLSVGFHVAGPQSQSIAEVEKRPALAFDQFLVNLGKIPPGPYAWGYFAFTNRGDAAVEIDELKPSCGCLNPKLDRRTFEPGESGEFMLRIQTAGEEPGDKEYYCDVLYRDPAPRQARVTFKVTLPEEQVVVRPKALIIYQLNGEPTTQEIVVSDFRKRQLRVIGASCSSELAAVDLGEWELDENGVRLQKVVVKVSGKVPGGRHSALVTIFTSDEAYPELQVPLLIQGPGSDGTAADRASIPRGH